MGRHGEFAKRQLDDRRLIVFDGERERGRRWRPRWLGRRLRRLAVPLGAAAAAAGTAGGIALALSAAPVAVSMDDHAYRIGGMTLRAVGPREYAGTGTVVVTHAGPVVRAASSSMVDGRHVLGVCNVSADGLSELCLFDESGRRSLTAVDDWRAGAWRRRYADGASAVISAAPGTPVPFLVR